VGEWKQLNPYCMVTDGWMVTKYQVQGSMIYVLFKGNERVGMYDSFSEAKSHAK
jgi:hypothetical protein